uniref:Uncharacterized protein n=1 Tax=viral metagenome TaxID=1070528 RepID=A0A6C0CAL0_9ZZZZ
MSKYKSLIHKLLLINKIIKHRDVGSLLKKNLIYLQFQKIILIDDLNIISHAFEYIYQATNFHHIKYNGSPYYETENMWRVHNIKKRGLYDLDYHCDGHHECTRPYPQIYPIKGDKVKYIIEPNLDFRIQYDDLREFATQILPYDIKNVLFVGFDKRTIVNEHGENFDRRGSNHCNVYLQMFDKVSIKKCVTLHNLAIAFYSLKSHKWDKRWEMFGSAVTKREENNIKVFLGFDHNR